MFHEQHSSDDSTFAGKSGLGKAIENKDDWWWSSAMAALHTEAATGFPFDAYTLTVKYGIANPDHPGRWGGLFSSARHEGVIEGVGYCVSQRPTRSGGITRLWRGKGVR
ncbi:hypothetical protein MTX38_22075 [Rhodococcus sp. ARC_M13]|uniref:hypothetical protein n=1 Tax=Rhodococcus sp. ARC_M13 TaxID=2928855 RepID=UPI001FB4FD02|nr:hypothetical protein [Rhodococcus sp. ARC_M13]MCJ0899767.1 hypothetical protein [Rhodococcus sp. ARC_M13]